MGTSQWCQHTALFQAGLNSGKMSEGELQRASCVYARTGRPNARASPKSASLSELIFRSMSRFCGFRSLWSTLWCMQNTLVSYVVGCTSFVISGWGLPAERHNNQEGADPDLCAWQ